MSLKAWLVEQQRYAAANAQRRPLWTGTTIVLYVYGINGIVGEVASAVGRHGWDLHGMVLLVAALGAAIGGTIAARHTRISATAT
jgi:hypothetical protein